MQWNPDIATQLVVASDEDSSPSVRVLTLRKMLLYLSAKYDFEVM